MASEPGHKQELDEQNIPASTMQKGDAPSGEDQSSISASDVESELEPLYHKPPTRQFVLIMIAYVTLSLSLSHFFCALAFLSANTPLVKSLQIFIACHFVSSSPVWIRSSCPRRFLPSLSNSMLSETSPGWVRLT